MHSFFTDSWLMRNATERLSGASRGSRPCPAPEPPSSLRPAFGGQGRGGRALGGSRGSFFCFATGRSEHGGLGALVPCALVIFPGHPNAWQLCPSSAGHLGVWGRWGSRPALSPSTEWPWASLLPRLALAPSSTTGINPQVAGPWSDRMPAPGHSVLAAPSRALRLSSDLTSSRKPP